MTKDIDLDALQEAAEKASGWKWETARGNEFGHLNEDGCFYEIGSVDADQYAVNDEPHNETVLNFITRANPQTILSLIARIRELEGDTGKSAEADEQAAFKSVFKDYYAKHGFISSEKEALEFFRAGSSWAGRAAPEGIPYRATLEFDDGKRVITGVMPDVDGDTPQASPHAGPQVEDGKEG